MRNIETEAQVKKKQRRNQWIIGIVLIVVMLGSSFAIVVDSFGKQKSQKIVFNGVEFQQSNGLWFSQSGGFNLVSFYNPLQTENTSAEVKDITNYQNKPLYLYSESREAEVEIYRNLDPQSNNIVERIQQACPKDENCSSEIPVKDCSNNFIIIRYSSTSQSTLTQNQSCVLINSTPEKILEITDEYLFKLFGIK
ncbi:Uncharacterised protein [uncultured archaeon]|nr:Uncharacterised protein [uncultured archaeon]